MCSQLLPASAFGERGKYLRPYCRACTSRRTVEWRQRKRAELPAPAPVRRGAPVAAAPPVMPEHLDPAALAAGIVVMGVGPVRTMLAQTGAGELRAALLAAAVERARAAAAQTTSQGRAVRRILDPPGDR